MRRADVLSIESYLVQHFKMLHEYNNSVKEFKSAIDSFSHDDDNNKIFIHTDTNH